LGYKGKNILITILASILLSGCLGTHYLKKNEKLLYRQSLNAPKKFNADPLKEQFVQKPNRKLFVLPVNWLVWMYYWGERNYDQKEFIAKRDSLDKKFNQRIEQASTPKKKLNLQFKKQKKLDALSKKIELGNKRMQWGEKVSVFDSLSALATVSKFDTYLFNKGYFNGKTKFYVKIKGKRAMVNYWITPGPAYYYDTVIYKIPDAHVKDLILSDTINSLVKRDFQFDQEKLTKERERIDLYLKDHGFYDFSRQYVDYDIDTAYRANYRIALRLEIRTPSKRPYHKQFMIDSVSFTTDAGVTSDSKQRSLKVYRNVTFNNFKDVYSKKILGQRIFIYRDSLYNRTNTINTQRLLANLDNFKFVNINYDTTNNRVVANIFTSPLDKFSWTNEAGVTVTQGFPGPYYNMNFKWRNVFNGLESFDLNGRFGYEGVASATQTGNFYKSTEASINGSLTFPQFLFPFKEETGYRLGKFNPKTRLQAGYTYTDRPEYQRSITTVSNTYTWQNKKTIQYSLTLTSLSIIRSHIGSDAFQTTLENLQAQGNNLINSFKPSFVSSTIFSITYNPNNYGNNSRSSFFAKAQLEGGGSLFNFYTPTWISDQGLALYQFVRFNADLRWNKIIDKNTVLAYRFNSGVGYAYSANKVLPYEKYFFAGGSNSVRAWRPRRLGVGSNPPSLDSNPEGNGLFNYQFEKPGEILLEGSLELRKKLFGFLSGALFIDAGNVWSFNELIQSAGTSTAEWTGNTKFTLDRFYKEFGIGTGFGLRFDFSFLVLRLDVGMKAYDPGRKSGNRFVLDKVKFWGPYGTEREPVIYNIGIGYPF
jgi:outer membrane protein insertion porin family